MYKRIIAVLLLSALLCAVCVPGCAGAEETKTRKLTVMVYMCGSNLESTRGYATRDLREMMKSGFPEEEMSVIVMIGGSREWKMDQTLHSGMILELHKGNQYTIVREYDEPMNMASGRSLTDLLIFGRENYPAEDYALIIWDHGGGPMGGMCLDELYPSDALSLDELTEALQAAQYPEKLSWIGFDACLMGSVEVASVLVPYAEYMIASQETEPSSGWNYAFLKDASRDGESTGRSIADCYLEKSADLSDPVTMSCIRLDRMDALVAEMDAFFASLNAALNEETFASLSRLRFTVTGFGETARSIGENGYDLVDLGDLIARYGAENTALSAALRDAVVYVLPDDGTVSGLSVYHPYLNKQLYLDYWRNEYSNLDFCSGYTGFIEHFGNILTGEEYVDWSRMIAAETAGGTDLTHTYSLQLTPEQAANFLSGELFILKEGWKNSSSLNMYPVFVAKASMDENGLLTASYSGDALYAVDEDGSILASVSFMRVENSEYYYVVTWYNDYSFRETTRERTFVLYKCRLNPDTREFEIVGTYPRDPMTGTYTNRVEFSEEGFTDMCFYHFLRNVPDSETAMPGFDAWEDFDGYLASTISLPRNWRLQLVGGWNNKDLYAMFQITDVRQNTWSSVPVRADNPKEINIPVTCTTQIPEDLDLTFSAVCSHTTLHPGLTLTMSVSGKTDQTVSISGSYLVVNGCRSKPDYFSIYGLKPADQEVRTCFLNTTDLTGLTRIDSVDFILTVRSEDDRNAEPVVIPVHLEFRDCDISDFAPEAPVALDEFREESVVWQLISLQQDPDGSVTGLLHVENHDAEPLDLSGSLFVNGVSSNDAFRVRLAPDSDAYFPFSMANGSYLSGLHFKDSAKDRFLTVSQALEQAGVDSADRIDLYFDLNLAPELQNARQITLRAPEGVPLQEPREMPASAVLLDGHGVTVSLERLIVADDGIGLALRLRNDSDEYVSLSLLDPVLNGGETDRFAYTSYDYHLRVVMPPHSVSVLCEPMEFRNTNISAGVPVEEVRLAFQSGNRLTAPAVIRFPEGVVFGEKDGRELPAAELSVTPAVFRDEPMALNESVKLTGSSVHPVYAEAPVSAEQPGMITSGFVSLCVVSFEQGPDPDDPVLPVMRIISRIPLETGSEKCCATLSGLSVVVQDRFLYTTETRLAENVWQLKPNYIAFYPEDSGSADSDRSPETEDPYGHHYESEVCLNVEITEGAAALTKCDVSLLDLYHERYMIPRSNVYLSEIRSAVIESWFNIGTDRAKYPVTRDDYEKTPLSLDEPVTFSLVPFETIPGDKGLYYVLNYEDGSREDILVDLASGEILDRTFTPAEQNPFRQ